MVGIHATVAAFDVITAFAVPNLSDFSQNRRVLVASWVAPLGWSLSLLRIDCYVGHQPFSTVDDNHSIENHDRPL